MHASVVGDPRFLYSYSPRDTAGDTRYVFGHGEKAGDVSIKGLQSAAAWVMDNPPTEADHDRPSNSTHPNYHPFRHPAVKEEQ